ncbi:hypothetical protein SAMN05443428_13513 [Caloramator quimbayensis]|uniref:Uncharacterized protein n=1 Tax=Caloramator quimbayensis TaxID=1147123 RepID=A0A1T4YC25_9CLOT|nr:hypothetical protein [Caloramator quimbayensis]SKA99334.1 hypothetical protein SAMN05443428_13513 [Caloramator quimbayensis]
MLHYYIQRGHSIKELLQLDEYEKLFYIASMDKAISEEEGLIENIKRMISPS